MNHKLYCNSKQITRPEFPTEDFIQFKEYEKMIRVPVVIYCDFESILKPVDICNQRNDISSTTITHVHEPMSFCMFAKGYRQEPYLYRGPDSAAVFMKELEKIATEIEAMPDKAMEISRAEMDQHEQAAECYLCRNEFTQDNYKVHDHCHFTDQYRGAACNSCNLRCKRI